MFDEIMVWIFGVAVLAVAMSLAGIGIFVIRKCTQCFFPAWDEVKTLFPVPEGVSVSFWWWQKAFVRYKSGGSLWPLRIKATEGGLLLYRGSLILLGGDKDSMIYIEWDQLVYPYKVPFPWSRKFFRPHVEFQVSRTEISIIASRDFWEPSFPEGFLDDALEGEIL